MRHGHTVYTFSNSAEHECTVRILNKNEKSLKYEYNNAACTFSNSVECEQA